MEVARRSEMAIGNLCRRETETVYTPVVALFDRHINGKSIPTKVRLRNPRSSGKIF
jgi:hypothetical protein